MDSLEFMHLRRCQAFQPREAQPWEKVVPRELSEADRRAIFSVCDGVIGSAGRTAVMMALRGSRAEKIRRLGLTDSRGHGHFSGMSEDEVLARIDTLIHERLLEIEWNEAGLPVIAYTNDGLEQAVDYAADEWFEELRQVVERDAGDGVGGTDLPFLKELARRNHETALALVERVAEAATPAWLPVLRKWDEAEIRRVRNRLEPVIARLERGG